ncbi:MAG: lytic transglycosylase domain-containing protein [Gammaproteobacteria bacterium]|nr:lytic transglycosylase domain-containing protein [Gammaproteobacteria bacterium]
MNIEHHPILQRIAQTYDLPVALVSAIVLVESSGDPFAMRYEPLFFKRYVEKQPGLKAIAPCSFDSERIARATSWGLMQVMGQTARERGFNGPFLSALCAIETGLEYGCKHLAYLANHYFKGSWHPVIAAYSAGSPRQVGDHYVNQNYVDKVIARYERLA